MFVFNLICAIISFCAFVYCVEADPNNIFAITVNTIAVVLNVATIIVRSVHSPLTVKGVFS